MKKGIAILIWVLSGLCFHTSMMAGTPMQGSYIVDSSGATAGTNFKSLQAAFASLDSNGASGKVTFLLAKGSYPALQIDLKNYISKGVVSLCRLSTTGPVTFSSISFINGFDSLILDTLIVSDSVINYNKMHIKKCNLGLLRCRYYCTIVGSDLGFLDLENVSGVTVNNCNIKYIWANGYVVGKVSNSIISADINLQSSTRYTYNKLVIDHSKILGKIGLDRFWAEFEHDSIHGNIYADTSHLYIRYCQVTNSIHANSGYLSCYGSFFYSPVSITQDEDYWGSYFVHNTISSASGTALKINNIGFQPTNYIYDNILICTNGKPALDYYCPYDGSNSQVKT